MKKILEPFRPVPILVEKEGGRLCLESVRPDSIGPRKSVLRKFRSAGARSRLHSGVWSRHPAGTEDAVLNANYIRKNLEGVYDLPYSLPSMHEVVFSDAHQKRMASAPWTSPSD